MNVGRVRLLLKSVIVLTWLLGSTWRCTFYWRFPVCGGDPYGLGDILEALLQLAAVGLSAVGLLWAVIGGVLSKAGRPAAMRLGAVSIAAALIGGLLIKASPCNSERFMSVRKFPLCKEGVGERPLPQEAPVQ